MWVWAIQSPWVARGQLGETGAGLPGAWGLIAGPQHPGDEPFSSRGMAFSGRHRAGGAGILQIGVCMFTGKCEHSRTHVLTSA